MSDSDSESELVGRKHQELQALAYFTKKKLDFEYDTSDIPEFESVIRSRPDFLFRGEINVIVEIDENAHAGYSPDDEVSRMKTIWKAFDKNVVFIRLAVDRSKELSGRILKDVYHMILEYQSLTDTRSRLVVHYVNYPYKELKKYRRYNGNINIVNFEDDEDEDDIDDDNEDEDEDDEVPVTTTVTTITTTTTTTTTIDTNQFKCYRCGYKANCSRDLRSHLNRKYVCKPLDDNRDIPREDLLKELNEIGSDKRFKCEYCKKLYSTKPNLTRHIKTCKEANKSIRITKKELKDMNRELLEDFKASQASYYYH